MTPSERQERYIAKLKAQKKCIRCRDKSIKGKCLCKACTLKARLYMRARTGSAPWKKGSRGRPPKYD